MQVRLALWFSKPLLGLAILFALASPAAAAEPPGTVAAVSVSGIPLDAAWKQKLYAFARARLLHPAWGWTHSERDYRLARTIAAAENLRIDTDVLFAAAFVHDIGAIGDFQKEGVDHAVRSAELAGPLLRQFGFPEQKIAAVREAILGHMHDKVPGRSSEAIALHDADALDFLGTVGVARRLSVTGSATHYAGGIARIAEFADKLPERIVTATARRMAVPRIAEMRQFLKQLDDETARGRVL
ncbi:MAG TPA: HD domain-containing protein [Allosphingosinicella sp.]|jgi:uncharacterized protein